MTLVYGLWGSRMNENESAAVSRGQPRSAAIQPLEAASELERGWVVVGGMARAAPRDSGAVGAGGPECHAAHEVRQKDAVQYSTVRTVHI